MLPRYTIFRLHPQETPTTQHFFSEKYWLAQPTLQARQVPRQRGDGGHRPASRRLTFDYHDLVADSRHGGRTIEETTCARAIYRAR